MLLVLSAGIIKSFFPFIFLTYCLRVARKGLLLLLNFIFCTSQTKSRSNAYNYFILGAAFVEPNPKLSRVFPTICGFNLKKALQDKFRSNFSIAVIINSIYVVLFPRGMFYWDKSKFINSITLERFAQLWKEQSETRDM